jgi:predicted nucleic acid-binding Zn ribbon protein
MRLEVMRMEMLTMKPGTQKSIKAHVHCPICTHTVGADVQLMGKKARITPGQKCPRCSSALDAAMVLEVMEAA